MTWEPDYVTVAELKAELHVTDAVDDAPMARWVTSASRAVDTYCHRQFGQVSPVQARTYESVWDRHRCAYVAEIDDVQDLTGLIVVAGTTTLTAATTTASGYRLLPFNALLKGQPYTQITVPTCGTLTMTALWGWTAVPVSVKQATLLQAQRFAARRDSPYGVAGSPSEGSEIRLLAKVDPDVETVLGKKYRREWWAA